MGEDERQLDLLGAPMVSPEPVRVETGGGGEPDAESESEPEPEPEPESASESESASASASAPASAPAPASEPEPEPEPESEPESESESESESEPDAETGSDAEPEPRLPALESGADFMAPSLDVITVRPRLSRFVGATLGAAIGDAMGHPTEFLSVSAIHDRWGPDGVTGFELYWDRDGRRFAPYTDDTQMAEVVLRSLLWSREQDADLDGTMRVMAQGFVDWSKDPQGGHRAPGNACMSGCRALARGTPWYEAGGPTAGGCGSVMRAYPFGLLFKDDLERAERWAVAHSRLTHGDPIAKAACAAMAVGMARILRDEPLNRVLSEMVAAACRYSPRTAAMMARAIDEAQSGVGPGVVFERLQAWAAHEAIAAAVYLLARWPDDPRAAILEGANTPGDSDSIATLGGALVGARAGVAALPRSWVDEVERSRELMGLACSAAEGS